MESVGSFEAKTHLPQLLERVSQGEEFTITKHGKPVAKLVPASAAQSKPDVRAAWRWSATSDSACSRFRATWKTACRPSMALALSKSWPRSIRIR